MKEKPKPKKGYHTYKDARTGQRHPIKKKGGKK